MMHAPLLWLLAVSSACKPDASPCPPVLENTVARALSVSSDGSLLVFSVKDSTAVSVRNPAGAVLYALEIGTTSIARTAFSPDMQRLAVVAGTKMSLWDLGKRAEVASYQHETNLGGLAYCSGGATIVVGTKDAKVIVLNALTLKVLNVISGHTGSVSSVACSPDGRFVTGSSDSTVLRWDADGTLSRNYSGWDFPTSAVAWSPDGKYIAAGCEKSSVCVWLQCSSRILPCKVATIETELLLVHSIAFTPDGSRLIVGGVQVLKSPVSVISTSGWKTEASLQGSFTSSIFAVAGDSRLVWVAGASGAIRLWALYDTTPAPPTPAPATLAPPTPAPPTPAPVTPAPHTPAPATPAPATGAPTTPLPATQAPATPAPHTDAPATQAPTTPAPATGVPPTVAPATAAPPTATPPTPMPETLPPQTAAPATGLPSTAAPPVNDTEAAEPDAAATPEPGMDNNAAAAGGGSSNGALVGVVVAVSVVALIALGAAAFLWRKARPAKAVFGSQRDEDEADGCVALMPLDTDADVAM